MLDDETLEENVKKMLTMITKREEGAAAYQTEKISSDGRSMQLRTLFGLKAATNLFNTTEKPRNHIDTSS